MYVFTKNHILQSVSRTHSYTAKYKLDVKKYKRNTISICLKKLYFEFKFSIKESRWACRQWTVVIVNKEESTCNSFEFHTPSNVKVGIKAHNRIKTLQLILLNLVFQIIHWNQLNCHCRCLYVNKQIPRKENIIICIL